MTEDEARQWAIDRWPAAIDDLVIFEEMLRAENARQNLVSAQSLDALWSRHIVDSAQLVDLAPASSQPWIDIGTGGGFPGLVCAMLRPERFILVEPRRRRADFLTAIVQRLGLQDRVEVAAVKIERLSVDAGTVSARAVAPISDLLANAANCIGPGTTCLFPRGTIDDGDVAHARRSWSMMFHVEPSITNPASQIAVLRQVKPR